MLSNAAFDYFSTLYKTEYCMDMIRFCSKGRSPEAFAAEINVTPEIFPFWAINHIEFEIALHISFWKSYSWWEERSQEPDSFNSKGFAPIFNAVMKNRFKWKDGQEDLQKLVKKMSTADLETLARRLLTEKTREIEQESDDEEPEE